MTWQADSRSAGATDREARLEAAIVAAGERAVALRHELHRIPEVGLELPLTQAVIERELTELGIPVRRGTGLSSVVGVIRGQRPGPTVLLRADMDALPLREESGVTFASAHPGSMHACGHDLHMAGLLGAARVLAGARAELAGAVVLMFQPGEEGFHGARLMIEEGVLDAPDAETAAPAAAFALHCNPWYPTGTLNTRTGPILAANDRFEVVLRGSAGHGSAPHAANDPIPALAELVGALQALVARHTPPFDPVVLSVTGLRAGDPTTGTAIPAEARLWGTLRTLSAERRAATHAAIERLARGIGEAGGLEASCEIVPGYPATVNDGGVREAATPHWERRLPAGVRTLEFPLMGSEDFSYVLERIPGVLGFIGTTPEHELRAATPADNHSDRVRYDDRALEAFVRAHLAFVEARLGVIAV